MVALIPFGSIEETPGKAGYVGQGAKSLVSLECVAGAGGT